MRSLILQDPLFSSSLCILIESLPTVTMVQTIHTQYLGAKHERHRRHAARYAVGSTYIPTRFKYE